MNIKTNSAMLFRNTILSLMLLASSFHVQSSFPVRWSLDEQLAAGQKIALVEVVSVSNQSTNRLIKKEAIFKVEVDLLNSNESELIKVVTFNGIAGSDLGLDCIGQKAIVILEKSSKEYFGDDYYQSVNNYFSVYKVKDNIIQGLSNKNLSKEEALEILKGKVNALKNRG